MEENAVGTLTYINNHLLYKPRNDLTIYKASELESIFVKIRNPKKTNIINGCIYKHLCVMDINEFFDDNPDKL